MIRSMNTLKQEKDILQQSVDALQTDKAELQTQKHKVGSHHRDSGMSEITPKKKKKTSFVGLQLEKNLGHLIVSIDQS